VPALLLSCTWLKSQQGLLLDQYIEWFSSVFWTLNLNLLLVGFPNSLPSCGALPVKQVANRTADLSGSQVDDNPGETFFAGNQAWHCQFIKRRHYPLPQDSCPQLEEEDLTARSEGTNQEANTYLAVESQRLFQTLCPVGRKHVERFRAARINGERFSCAGCGRLGFQAVSLQGFPCCQGDGRSRILQGKVTALEPSE
jgi:hypothetical protein